MHSGNSEIQEFSVQGMSCAGCAGRIERVLSQTPGNVRAKVDFARQTAIVQGSNPPGEIVQKIESLGFRATIVESGFSFEERHRAEQTAARQKLALALLLGVPVIALGMMHAWSHLPWVQWTSAALTFALLLGPARDFFVKAAKLMRQRTSNMDTLVALGSGITFLWSCVLAAKGSGSIFFETAAAIVVFVMIGKFIEQRMTWRAQSSLGALLQLQPAIAQRQSANNTGEVESVDLRFVRTGDRLLTRVGERFAADGLILEGQTEVDESLLTGESQPVPKAVGDRVIAGSLNKVGAVVFTVEAVGEQSRLGEIIQFVERTQLSKAPIQRLADRVSAVFVPVILSLSAITFLVWNFLIRGELQQSLNAALSVLVVACPCALGLATPIAVVIATGRAARGGILFRDLAALELLQSVQTIVFDKTGTLTEGTLSVAEECWLEIEDQQQVLDRPHLLKAVHRLEQRSQHPVATAMVEHLKLSGAADAGEVHLDDIRESVGHGMSAVWLQGHQRHTLEVGRPAEPELDRLPNTSGVAWVVCRLDGRMVVAWGLRDALRSNADAVLNELKRINVRAILASGDQPTVVQSVAGALGLEAFAGQTPQMKAELIQRLRAEGQVVAMLGDGVNDAPALAAADVGIAMGSGTDAAQQTAALTLKDTSLVGLLGALQLSRVTFANIRQNLGWAFGYNIVLIPLAMMGRLTPMWAAAAMVFSSLFVVLNSLRLLRFEVPRQSSAN